MADVVDYYARRMEALEDQDYADFWENEVLLLLTTRDTLCDRWRELDSEQRDRVLAVDQALTKKHALVAQFGPVPNPNVTDRRRWWWFLHQGPQVRQQAAAAARE